jgi:hypothetical protein
MEKKKTIEQLPPLAYNDVQSLHHHLLHKFKVEGKPPPAQGGGVPVAITARLFI